jgi:hypothetical protein
MTRPAAPPGEAIAYLTWAVGWAGGRVPVFIDGAPEPHLHVCHNEGVRLAELAARWDHRANAQVEIALPPDSGRGTVLWVWLESKESLLRAWRRFRPAPAVVLAIGSSCRRLCIWPLTEILPSMLVENANKRLAYALHAPQKYAPPEALRIPLPGTFLRVGRKRPAAIVPTRFELDTWRREQLVGRLKDPPRPYMDRLRAGEIPGRS